MEHRHKSASISFLSLVLLAWVLDLRTVQLVFCSADVDVGCMNVDRKALLKFKEGLTDPSDRLSSWVGEDCCKWRGIGCNNTTGLVESLNLRNSYSDGPDSDSGTLHALGGQINPFLLDLKDIVYLDLSMNNFGGLAFPSFIGSLEKLKYLNLSGASFGGIIPPNLGNLSRLLCLDLSHYLVEPIENDLTWLPSLSSLRYLDLGGVDLTKAEGYWLPTVNMLPSLVELHLSSCGLSILPLTPPHFNFTSLLVLDLSSNGFNSTIPPWLFNLTKLVHLDLKSNNLYGMLPEAFGRLTSLKTLDLSENSNIESQLPRNLGLLCNLQTLKLSVNKISGEITEVIDSLSGCANSTLETLDLGYNNLSGNLPSSLGYLKSLRYLKLWYNSFHGSIPESIGNLTSLEDFYLTNNQMDGSIPESFGQLSSLVALEFSYNKWEGVITEAHFFKLRSLEEVSIIKNSPNISLIFNISSVWIPPFKLRYLSISSCQLGPKFPTWLRNQTELSTVGLINARISDTIPDWFWQLDLLLDDLDVSNNEITGRVPNSLRFSLRGLVTLSSNHFEGPLPIWSNVSGLYLRDNQFSGPIPHNIGELMPLLEDVDISRNSFTGGIPLSIGNLSRLTTLVISNNHLSGEVPNFWNSLPEVYIVDMSKNSLSGAMPSSMGFFSTLRFLILSNNKFSGKLPLLKNCTGMKSLDLGDNNFSGNIPAWIGESMLSLWILRLSSNSFTGNIPSQLCGLSNLHILDLSNNDLICHIPICVGNLSGLKISEAATDTDTTYLYQGELEVVSKGRVLEYGTILYLVNSLDISNNSLSGEMPVELTRLIMLGTLNLSMNHLTGIIPENIGKLKSIETLDLSMNNLSGSIPQGMVSLTFMTHLNLSHNNLAGKIPTSNQFNSLIDPSIYEGNAALCGNPLPTPCRDNEETPQVPSEDAEGEDGKSEKVWIMISTAIGFILGFWVVFGSLVIKKTWRYAYFRFLDKMRYALLDFLSAIGKRLGKRSGIHELS